MLVDIYDFAINKQINNMTNYTGDVVYDFGAAERGGEMTPFDFYFCTGADTTATGNPKLDIIIETADDDEFTENAVEHIMFKDVPKERLSETSGVLVQRLPFGMGRYARLKLTATAEIACMDFSAGITPAGQQNRNRVPMSPEMADMWAPKVKAD